MNRQSNIGSVSVWSVDRIARLVVGISNCLVLITSVLISPYFLIILGFINLNLIFTSLTDKCPFKTLLKRLGAKERENYFKPNGALIKTNKNSNKTVNLSSLKNAL
ncbi:MAG: hypothetical protein COA79_23765 [Planctomycetota bacterium]|nr:MAG: hypothetical protein COA79_23765 [Planctomycetota bacterium]